MKFLVTITPRADADIPTLVEALPGSSKVVWDLYLRGMIREMYQHDDDGGTVLIAEAPDAVSLRNALALVPLIQSGQVVEQIIGLKPFAPLAAAFAAP